MLWERLGREEGWEIEIGMQYVREKKVFYKSKREKGRKEEGRDRKK